MSVAFIKAIEFWKWFESISNDLKLYSSSSELLGKLDSYISSIGPFDWEIGPSDDSDFYFAISPNLNEDFLNAVHQIIELAPKCKGWVFLPAKPPKGFQDTFQMYNEHGALSTVDTSKWQYVLYKFNDGTFDMDIKICKIDGNLDDSHLAVDICLTNFLGKKNIWN